MPRKKPTADDLRIQRSSLDRDTKLWMGGQLRNPQHEKLARLIAENPHTPLYPTLAAEAGYKTETDRHRYWFRQRFVDEGKAGPTPLLEEHRRGGLPSLWGSP